MSLNAEQRTARARNAAYVRHHPGADFDELERQRTDRAIDEIVARASRLTDEQANRLARMLRHPCGVSDCTNRVSFYEQFCGHHRV